MRRIFFLFFVFITSLSLANTNQVLIDSAREAYGSNEFELAINYYEQILNTGYEAPEVYFNLGNSYYKSNKLTLAIINYERALLLAPDDEEIQFNLNIARNYVVDKIEALPRLFIYNWIDSLLYLKSSDAWTKLSLGTFILMLILFLFYFFTNNINIKKISFWFGILLIIVSVLSFLFSAKQKKNIELRNSAIVYSSSVTIKSSPDLSGNDLFVLHEGTKVIVEDSIHDWGEIKIADGNKGWLKASDVVVL